MNSGRFVGHKGNKQDLVVYWCVNKSYYRCLHCSVVERGIRLWNYFTCGRQCAVCYTDFWEAYAKWFRLNDLWEGNWQTNHKDSTILYVKKNSRLVRKATSFSKKLILELFGISFITTTPLCLFRINLSSLLQGPRIPRTNRSFASINMCLEFHILLPNVGDTHSNSAGNSSI